MCSILAYCSGQADSERVEEMLSRTISRGPDDSRILDTGNGFLGFNRLAIMGLTPAGMQPFTLNGNSVVCNGELYRFRKMKERLIEKGYTFMSDSDCEILLPLYEEYGIDMFRFQSISRRGIRSGSGRCILAEMRRGFRYSRRSRRAWWESVRGSSRFRQGTTL